jgi:hypothetical protein
MIKLIFEGDADDLYDLIPLIGSVKSIINAVTGEAYNMSSMSI